MQDVNQDDAADPSAAGEFVNGQRTCVVCYGDAAGGLLENTTHMVMMDSRGYPVDTLQLPAFSGIIPSSPSALASLSEDDRKKDDVEKIVRFLSKHWPHLIVISANSPECRQLAKDLQKIAEVDFLQVRVAPTGLIEGVCCAVLCLCIIVCTPLGIKSPCACIC